MVYFLKTNLFITINVFLSSQVNFLKFKLNLNLTQFVDTIIIKLNFFAIRKKLYIKRSLSYLHRAMNKKTSYILESKHIVLKRWKM